MIFRNSAQVVSYAPRATRDLYHDIAKHALVKDGWTITHDPFPLRYGIRRLYADLGAEKLIAAEKGTRRIAVEIKSFVGDSEVDDLKEACGAFDLYKNILLETHPEYELYLAVSKDAFDGIFSEPLGQLMIAREALRLFVFAQETEAIIKWIP